MLHFFIKKSAFVFIVLLSSISSFAEQAAKAYPIKEVDQLFIKGNAVVYFAQSNEEFLRIDADSEQFREITVDQTQSTLSISSQKNANFSWNWNNNDDESHESVIKIILQLKQVNQIDLSGIVSLKSQDLTTDYLQLNTRGAVKAVFAKILAKDFTVDMSGASKLTIEEVESEAQEFDLSGAAKVDILESSLSNKIEVSLSGAGKINAKNLRTKNAKVELSGASFLELSVSETLLAETSGTSKLTYYGNPTVKKDTSGISSVKQGEFE
jgi:Putative auto-transporter adhesin, head GIN domain